jgi:hypothetical protein
LAATDLELRNLVSEVAREGLQYLAIRATDAGDAIFLANRVRDVAPNVRLIFLGSDILYLHPHFRDDLRGSYVASGYPFFGTSDFSSIGSAHTHRPWSSQSAEGVYNATVGIFGADEPPRSTAEGEARLGALSEYAPFRPADADAGGACATGTPLLPLWITVIGNGAPLPLDAVIPDPSGRASLYDPCRALAPPQSGAASPDPPVKAASNEGARLVVDDDVTPPHGWRFALYVLVVVILLHFFFGAQDLRGCEGSSYGQRVYRAQYLAYSLARGSVLLAAFTYMVGVHSLSLNTYAWHTGGGDWPWALGSGKSIAWAVLVAGAFAMCARKAWRAGQAIHGAWQASGAPVLVKGRRFARALFAPAALSAGVLGLLLVMAILDAQHFRGAGRILGVAYTLRALPLGSGASSALVVVFVAGALTLWTTDRMRRIRLSYLLSWCAPPIGHAQATPIGEVVGDDDVKALEAEVQLAIDRSSSDPRSFGRSLLIGGVPLLALLVQKPTTVDGRADGLVLVALVTASTVLFAITLQHLAEFHVAFRRLLRRLRNWRLAGSLDYAPGITGATVLRILARNIDEVEPFAACVVVAGDVDEAQLPKDRRDELARETDAARKAREVGGLTRTQLGTLLINAARDVAQKLGPAPLPFPDAEGKPRDGTASTKDVAGQRFVGCVMAVLLEIYVRHIRYYVRGVSAPAVLLVGVLGTYPFEPHRLFLAGAWILILALAGVSLWVYLALERDVVLSKVSGTRPNEVPINRELVVTILTVVVLPLLSVFAAQYPDVGRAILRVFDPFSSVLK